MPLLCRSRGPQRTPVRWGAWTAAAFVFYCLLVWAPLAGLFAAPFSIAGKNFFSLLVPGTRGRILLIQSLAFAIAAALASTCAATMAALYCWRRSDRLSRWAERAVLLTAPIPPYLHALAWLPVFAALPGRGAGEITGWISAVWVQSVAMLPFCFGLTWFALESLDPRTLDSARVFGNDRRMLLRVILPLLRPACVASVSLALLLTLTDYSVPSLFSRSTYAMGVFEEFSANHDTARAMLMSAPLVLAGVLALVPLARFWRLAAQRPARSGAQPNPLQIRGIVLTLLWAAAAVAVLPALALATTLLRHIAQPLAWTQSLSAGAGDTATSASVAFLAALLAAVPALAVSKALTQRPTATWWLVTLPLAMPPALSGIGLIWLWNRNLPVPVYGTFAMLVLASLARLTPWAVLAVAAWRSRLDPVLLEAGAVFAPPARAFFRVELPLLSPGVAVGGAIVFALSIAELGATLLIMPPGSGTLALRIYNYLHYGASGSVAALAFVLMITTAGSLLAVARLWRSR